MSEIIPAILPRDTLDLKEKLSQMPDEIKLVHMDMLEEDIWVSSEWRINKEFEVHLMVREPESIIDKWIERGARRIIVHSLGTRTAKLEKIEIGLAVEMYIPLEEIFPLIPQVDFVHLMSIAHIGAQGHPFEPKIFDRIRTVKEKFPQAVISVDGGVNVTNYHELIAAGVDRLVVGSGFKDLWKSLTKN